MILHEEGQFQLTDPVAKYLPELAKLEVREEQTNPATGEVTVSTHPARNPITVRDLMRHTAGFTYGFFGDTEVDRMYREQGIVLERQGPRRDGDQARASCRCASSRAPSGTTRSRSTSRVA